MKLDDSNQIDDINKDLDKAVEMDLRMRDNMYLIKAMKDLTAIVERLCDRVESLEIELRSER